MAGKYRLQHLPDNARKTTIYIDEDVKERVRVYAARHGYSVSTWTAMLIEAEIERIEHEREYNGRWTE